MGSGRLAVPLAAAGHDVTGVDNDAAMLDRARVAWAGGDRRAAGSLTLIDHDLTTLSLADRFDLVILALNSVLLLDGRAAQQRALNVMRAHLAPSGRAVIDVWLPSRADLELYDGRQVLDWIRTDPDTHERVAKTWIATYDRDRDTARLVTTFDAQLNDEAGRRIGREDTICFLGAGELLAMAGDARLSVQSVFGDYAGTPWSAASERVVLIAGAG